MANPLPNPTRSPESLAERFWSLARVMENRGDATPLAVVQHVLAVLDRLEAGAVGEELTAHTLSFLALLRQQEIKGDLLYASPEQARGEQMDERSLVFSVGVLLFEKLTGRHPFGAEGNPHRLARIRRGELASGVNYFPKVPSALRAVLLRAMGPFPQDRYPSLALLRSDLEAFAGGRPVRAQTQVEALLPEQLHAARQAEVDDDAVTTTLGSAAIDPWRPFDDAAARATAPAASSVGARAPTDASTAAVPVDATANLRAARPAWLGPAGWMIAGGLIATLAFAALGGRDAAAPTPAGTASASATPRAIATDAASARAVAAPAIDAVAEAATETDAAVARAPTPPGTTGKIAAPAPVDIEDAAARAPGEPSPNADAFDPDAAGSSAAAAARACFDARRLAEQPRFGASLLFRRSAPEAAKVYFGSAPRVTPAERRCLLDALTGVSAGRAPDRNTIVVYTFWLSPGGARHQARIKP